VRGEAVMLVYSVRAGATGADPTEAEWYELDQVHLRNSPGHVRVAR